MRAGITLPAFLEWSDPSEVVGIAADAEAAGWDGVFLWDHVSWNPAWGGTPPMADPFVCLGAAAMVTSRVLLGTIVTPLPRRRPQVVARQIVTLDHLSGGRAVLGVGGGDDFEYEAFGESTTDRGARLDEALAVLVGLVSGEPVDFEGAHHRVHSPPSLPAPVNGHIPIWVGGGWPHRAPFERARRYDGVVPRSATGELAIDDLPAIRELVGRDDFEYVASGSTTSSDDTDAVRAWRDAGATFWLESCHPFGGRADAMRERIRGGPPRL